MPRKITASAFSKPAHITEPDSPENAPPILPFPIESQIKLVKPGTIKGKIVEWNQSKLLNFL